MIWTLGFKSTNVFFNKKSCGLVLALGSVYVHICLIEQICMCVLSVFVYYMCWSTGCLVGCVNPFLFTILKRVLFYLCVCTLFCMYACACGWTYADWAKNYILDPFEMHRLQVIRLEMQSVSVVSLCCQQRSAWWLGDVVRYMPVDLWSLRAGINNGDQRNMVLRGTDSILKNKTPRFFCSLSWLLRFCF